MTERVVYLKEWNRFAASYIAQGVIKMGLFDLVSEPEMKLIVVRMLNYDQQNFIDPGFTSKEKNR